MLKQLAAVAMVPAIEEVYLELVSEKSSSTSVALCVECFGGRYTSPQGGRQSFAF